jgi:hypothetical protein
MLEVRWPQPALPLHRPADAQQRRKDEPSPRAGPLGHELGSVEGDAEEIASCLAPALSESRVGLVQPCKDLSTERGGLAQQLL